MTSLKATTTSSGKAAHNNNNNNYYYYLEEVIGRKVEIKFDNDDDDDDGGQKHKHNNFYYCKGQITDIQITYKKKKGKDNNEKKKQQQQHQKQKRSIKYIHHLVEFDDGDSGWINLMEMEFLDRLRWPPFTNNCTNNNNNNSKQSQPQTTMMVEAKRRQPIMRSGTAKINNNMKEGHDDGSFDDDEGKNDVVGSEDKNNENEDDDDDDDSEEAETEDFQNNKDENNENEDDDDDDAAEAETEDCSMEFEDEDDEDVSEYDDDYENGKKKQRNDSNNKKPKKIKRRRRRATTISELEDQFEIGTGVTVYWPSHDEWYKGTVISEMEGEGRVLIEYDDGETNWLDVIADKWRRSTKPNKFIKRDTTRRILHAEKIAKLKVGSRISVWWPGEKEWYTGTLSELKKMKNTNDNDDNNNRLHRISYDDGDEEWTNLIHRKFRRVQVKAERLEVGYRVSVFNYEQKRNYRATVTRIDLKRASPHKVKYVDANKGKEWLNLNATPFLDIDHQRKKEPNVAVSALTLKKRKREFLDPTPNEEEKRRPPQKVVKREDDAVVASKRCEVPCAMCKSRAKRPRALSCHHILCKRCIQRQSLDLESCPLCQVPISSTFVKYDPEHVSYKAVEALSKTTAEVATTFSSASSASVDKKRFVPLRIIEACQSKRRDDREYKGYYWRFKGSKDRILRVGESIKEGVAVEQVDSKTGEIIEVFSSGRKAADITKVSRGSIKRVLERRGKANAGGFFWRFKGETHGPWPDPEPTNTTPVEQLDFETGDFLCSYTSLAEAKRAMGMRPNSHCIRCVCDGKGRATAQGYFWRWKGSKAMPNHLMGVSKICQIRKTRNGRVIKEFRTSRDAQAFLGDQCCWSTVCRYCREKGFYMGYYWEYRLLTKKKSAEEEVIGKRLRVKQQGINDEWLEGKITAFDSDAGTHTILFNSGTTRRHKLEDIIYEFKHDQGQKPVEQLDLKTGNVLATFGSISDAAKCVGKTRSNVVAVCTGQSGSSAGYFWRYKGSDALPPQPKRKRKIEQLCLETGRVIATFDTISAAGRTVGITTPGISYCCNGRKGSKSAGGFGWRFSKEEESTTS